jgi:hypothetical protein
LNLFYEVGDAPYGLFWPSIVPPFLELPFQDRGDGKPQTQRFPFVFPVPGSEANKTLNYSVYLPIQGSPGYDPHNRIPYAENFNPRNRSHIGLRGHSGTPLDAQRESNPVILSYALALWAPAWRWVPRNADRDWSPVIHSPAWTIVNGTRGPSGPSFGSNSYTSSIANFNYNALEVTLERRAADVTFLAAYTYSKAMDDSSVYGESVNFTNYRLSRALSQYDLTHNFVFSYNWLLPFEKAAALPKRLTQGWSLIGITRFASGFPVGISQSGNLSLLGASG